MNLQYLKWDSIHFKKKIYSIKWENNFDPLEFLTMLRNNKDNIDILYLFASELIPDYLNEELSSLSQDFFLADSKVTYSLYINEPKDHDFENDISKLGILDLSKDFIKLAQSSGHTSRFKLDYRFGEEAFNKMYELWLTKSLTGELANCVFGIIRDETVVSFVTLVLKNNDTGKIGLIATHSDYKGKGLAKKLIEASKLYLWKNNCSKLLVPTQKSNSGACKFYEKCGFKIENTEYIYHYHA